MKNICAVRHKGYIKANTNVPYVNVNIKMHYCSDMKMQFLND